MIKKRLSVFFGASFVLLYGFCLIYYAKDIGTYVVNSVQTCVNVIIPSLYCFIVLLGVIVSSGLYRVIGIAFSAVSRYIFRLREDLFPVFLISSAAGYPVGAKMISELYECGKIDNKEAERLLGFCYMGGPAFFCGTVGIKLYSSVRVGMIIFFCVFISNIIAAIISGLGKPVPPRDNSSVSVSFTLNGLIDSVAKGGRSIFLICTMIIFFSSFTAILDASGVLPSVARILSDISGVAPNDSAVIIKSVLDISNISSLTPMKYELLPICASLLSLGGLCVVTQVKSIIDKRILTNYFYLGRLLTFILTYFLCKIYIILVGLSNFMQVFATIELGVRQSSPMPSLFLLIMTILLLSNNLCSKIKINVL